MEEKKSGIERKEKKGKIWVNKKVVEPSKWYASGRMKNSKSSMNW